MKKVSRLVPTAEPNGVWTSKRESFRGVNLNVMDVAPNFVPDVEIFDDDDEEEEEEDDIEAKSSHSTSKE